MKKNAITMSGLLCLVATGARAQSFEQQVLKVGQEVSEAIPQTRRAAVFIAAIRGRGGDLESERRAALAAADGIVKNPDSFSIRQIGDVLERLDILRELFGLEDPARPALDKARNQLDELQRTLAARHFNPRPHGEAERRAALAAAAEIIKSPGAFSLQQIVDAEKRLNTIRNCRVSWDSARPELDEAEKQLMAAERPAALAAAAGIVKNPSAFSLHQIVDVAVRLDILRGSCAPGDPARSALDEARNQLTELINSGLRPWAPSNP